MRGFVRAGLRLFVIYSLLLFINSLQFTLAAVVGSTRAVQMNASSQSVILDLARLYLPYLIIWLAYGCVLLLLWMKSDSISKAIVVSSDAEQKNESRMKYDDYLSIGMTLVGLFILTDTIPEIVRSIVSYLASRTAYAKSSFMQEPDARQSISVVVQVLKLVLAGCLVWKAKGVVNLLKKWKK